MYSIWFATLLALGADHQLNLRPLQVKCSCDGKMAVVNGASLDDESAPGIVIFDVANQKVVSRFPVDDREVYHVNFVDRSTLLWTYGIQKGSKLWNTSRGTERDFGKITRGMLNVTEPDAGGIVATWTKDDLFIYDPLDWRKVSGIADAASDERRYAFNGMSFMDGGKQLAVISGDRRLGAPFRTIVFDSQTLREVRSMENSDFLPEDIVVSDEQRRIVLVRCTRYGPRYEFRTTLELRRLDLSLERELLLEDYHRLEGVLPLRLGGGMVFVGRDNPEDPNDPHYVTVLDDRGVIVCQWESEFGGGKGSVDVSPQLNTIIAVDEQGVLRCFPIIDEQTVRKIGDGRSK